jgi:hypothetical protein
MILKQISKGDNYYLKKKRSVSPTNMAAKGQFLFLIGYCLKKSSPLKLLGKMEPNINFV